MLAGYCLDAVQTRKWVYVLSGFKTIGFTRFITTKKFRFQFFQFWTPTVLLPYKDHLLRVGRSLFGCCSGSEMCFRSIWSENNWLHKVSYQGKVLIFISDIQFLLPNEINHFLAVNFHSVPRTAAARAERSADMSTSSSSLPSASSWVASASGTSAAGSSVTLWASRHRYARVSNLLPVVRLLAPVLLCGTQTRQVTDDQWKAFH